MLAKIFGTGNGWAAGNVWVGRRRFSASSPWMWYGSETGPIYYSYFATGQPNYNAALCLGYWDGGHYSWDDAVCTENRNFVCEKIIEQSDSNL